MGPCRALRGLGRRRGRDAGLRRRIRRRGSLGFRLRAAARVGRLSTPASRRRSSRRGSSGGGARLPPPVRKRRARGRRARRRHLPRDVVRVPLDRLVRPIVRGRCVCRIVPERLVLRIVRVVVDEIFPRPPPVLHRRRVLLGPRRVQPPRLFADLLRVASLGGRVLQIRLDRGGALPLLSPFVSLSPDFWLSFASCAARLNRGPPTSFAVRTRSSTPTVTVPLGSMPSKGGGGRSR